MSTLKFIIAKFRSVKVYSYAIRPDNQGIFIELSIDKQYAHLIRQDSHFWNVSGFQGNF